MPFRRHERMEKGKTNKLLGKTLRSTARRGLVCDVPRIASTIDVFLGNRSSALMHFVFHFLGYNSKHLTDSNIHNVTFLNEYVNAPENVNRNSFFLRL